MGFVFALGQAAACKAEEHVDADAVGKAMGEAMDTVGQLMGKATDVVGEAADMLLIKGNLKKSL